MQGPAGDFVLVLLLVVFFGIQQRSRPQQYYRYWMAGWLFVMASFMLFEVPDGVMLPWGPLGWAIRESLRLDTLTLGGLCFLVSYRGLERQPKRSLAWTLPVAAIICVQLDTSVVLPAPRQWTLLLMVLGEGLAVYSFWTLLPKDWRWQRVVNTALCVPWAALELWAIHAGSRAQLDALISAQIFVSAGLLHLSTSRARRLVRWTAAAGLGLWGLWYPAGILLHDSVWLPTFYQFWQLPKYIVGFAMIVEMFDAAESEVSRLAERYRAFYEDFRVLYENHPYPMWIYETNTLRVVSVNEAAVEHYGYSEREFLRMAANDLDAPLPEDADPVEELLYRPSKGRRVRHRSKDGSVAWVNVNESAILFQGREARLVMARDISEQLRMTAELTRRANFDALTGLPNRTLLEDRLEQSLERSRRDGRMTAVLAIDVDHFKQVNDTYGHVVGDECLKAIAARLKGRIRKADTLARVGGEEFMAVVGGLHQKEDAVTVAELLRGVLADPLELPGVDWPLVMSVSIGVALFPEDGQDLATLRRRADDALYEAKRTGRNRVCFANACFANVSLIG